VLKDSTLEYKATVQPDVANSNPVKLVRTIGSLGRFMLTVYKILLFDDETLGEKVKL
jgi:hypothetical protein